mmetsp:Transcript_15485/g.26871  ORF Transcript_15485/g.26871 Transcript_15485/m.26871 type:complete len:363 (+) Transcript_15485:167-1255(+)
MTMEEHQQHPTNAAVTGHGKVVKEGRQPFPVKVYEMLEDSDSKGFSHVVSWNAGGTGFMVHKKDLFISQIVPQYFNQTRYKSFQRQLSLYGFQRVTVGQNKGLRHHAKLRRGRYDLVRQMKPVGYKPRGITRIIEHHQQQPHDDEVAEPAAANTTTAVTASAPPAEQQHQPSFPMTSVRVPFTTRHTIAGTNTSCACTIPTVISSGSLDKHQHETSLVAGQQSHLISPVSEGEESSSEDHQDEENNHQDFLQKGLFEGMSFYLMSPTEEVLEEFLPAPDLTLDTSFSSVVPQSPMGGLTEVQMKKAFEIGYNLALSMKNTVLASDAATQLATPSTAPASQLLLEHCVDALDFHAVDVTSRNV